MKFDLDSARKAGYSDDEIADYLATENKFDLSGALKSGYSASEVIGFLSGGNTPAPAPEPVVDTGDEAARLAARYKAPEKPGLIERAVSAVSSLLPKPVDPMGIASGKPLGNTPIRAEEPVKERKEPTPYRNRREALDDAVNLLEEGADQGVVTEAFDKAGIKFDEIVAHGKKRGSDYFKQQPGMEVADSEVSRLAARYPAPPTGEMKAYETSVGEDIANFAKRVAGRSSQAFTGLLANTGVINEDQAATALARDERRIQAASAPESIQAGFEEIGQAKTYGDAAIALARNPGATATMLAESVLMTAPVLAASAARLPAVGLAAATGGFSASLEYGGAMADVLRERRIDMLDANKLAAALKDPEIVAEIRDKGTKRGLTIGLIDGLTAGIAGKFLEPVQKSIAAGNLAADAARRATVGAWAKELGVQVAGGSGGEFAAQQLTGENKPADVILEGLGEGVSAPFEARSNLATARKLDPSQQIADAIDGVDFTRSGIDATVADRVRTEGVSENISPIATVASFTPSDSATAQAGLAPIVVPVPTTAPETYEQPPVLDAVNPQVEKEFGLDTLRMGTSNVSTTGGTGAAPAVGGVAGSDQPVRGVGVSGPDLTGTGELAGGSAGVPAVNARSDVAAGSAAAQPAASVTAPENNNAVVQPVQTMTGRSKTGYATEQDATVAMQVGKKRYPELSWKIEPFENGRLRAVGYEPKVETPGIAGQQIDEQWTAFAPETGTKAVPRAEMPQIKAEHRGPMVNFLEARGVTAEKQEIPASDLKPTQAEFSQAKVQAAKDYTGGDRSILISSDNYVLDGHHQWLAKLDANEPVKVIRLNAPIEQLITTVRDFPSATSAEGATLGTQAPQAQQATQEGQQAPTIAGAASPAMGQSMAAGGAAQTQGGDITGVGAVAAGPVAGPRVAGALATPEGATTAGLSAPLRLAPPAPVRAIGKAIKTLRDGIGIEAEVDKAPMTEQQQAASAIARLSGRTVTVLKATTAGTLPNGFMLPGDNKNIYIANDADDAPLSIAMHEIYHTLPEPQRKALNTQLLTVFREDKRGDFAAQFKYDANNNDLLDEEIPAFMVQAISKREDFWQDLRTKMGNKEFGEVAKVIINKLNTLISGAKKEYGDEFVNKYITDVAKARDLLSTAYADAMREQGLTPDVATVGGVQPMASNRAAPETPEFKRWFGDSKVVDANGEPLVMYHATTGDFDTFKDNQRGVQFVSPSKTWVNKFLSSDDGLMADGANVMPVLVKASNPFDYEDKNHVSLLSARAYLNRNAVNEVKQGKWQRLEDRTVIETIKKLGFDGVYVSEDGVKNLAVFSPTQIKSATGNDGQFDASNPDIRRSNRAVEGNTPDNSFENNNADVMPPEQINADGIMFSLRKVEEINDAPEITMMDLVDETVFPILADLTAAGYVYMGKELRGGPFYTLLPSNSKAGLIWANDGKGVASIKNKKAARGVIGLIVAMKQDSHATNNTVANIIFRAVEDEIQKGSVAKADIPKLDDIVRGLATRTATKTRKVDGKKVKETKQVFPKFADFPGFSNRAASEKFLRAMPFEARGLFFEEMTKPTVEDLGLGVVRKVINDTVEPDLRGLNMGDVVMAIRFDPNADTIELGEKTGTPEHDSYRYGVKGEVIGKFKRPISFENVFVDLMAERRAAGKDRPAGNYRSLTLRKPEQRITKEIAGGVGQEKYKTFKTPAEAKAAVSAAGMDWKVIDRPAAAGVKEFLRTARIYGEGKVPSFGEAKMLIKDGRLRIFRLANTENWFSIETRGTKRVMTHAMVAQPGVAQDMLLGDMVFQARANGATHIETDGKVEPIGEAKAMRRVAPIINELSEMPDADIKNLGIDPKEVDRLNGLVDEGFSVEALPVYSRRAVESTSNFKRWAKNLPIVEDGGNDYEGGPAVFVAYHGTTHDDITEFKTIGNKEGALGQGPYMSTSVDDVNENYAGVGPDLTNRIGREEDNVRDSFYDDPWFATEVLDDYFASEGIDQEVTDENFDELKDEYGDKAISHAATARLKGKSDGLVMPVYVRMEKPFNMAGNPTYFEMQYPADENGELDYDAEPEGSAVELIDAINKVAGWYNADADSLTGWVHENGADGVSARELFDRAARDMSELYDDNGEMISSGQFIQEVAREMGFDGLIQDADLYFGTQRKGFGGIRAGAMKGVEPGTLHLMPFDGAQVKSATGNSGEFGENRQILRSNRAAPAFYSQLERVIANVPAKLATQPAAQWALWLDSNGPKQGVKKDEVEWSGIKDYLALRGKEKVTSAELQAYLKDSGVRVTETTLGEVDTDKILDDISNELYDNDYWDLTARQQDVVVEKMDQRYTSQTKYDKYTLPGGENYRELLITLPSKNSVAGISPVQAARVLFNTEYGQLTEAQQQEVKRRINDDVTTPTYMSSHWKETPNVLAHIRVNNRTDADGKRVLFVEEVQSDWGQDGLKKGFTEAEPVVTAKLIGDSKFFPGKSEYEMFVNGVRAGTRHAATMEDAIEKARASIPLLAAASNTKYGTTPRAPFVTKTEGWLNLALKRIAMLAVEEGYDKVAFVNGEQSADRYDLSKQISSISYEPGSKPENEGLLQAWDLDRKMVMSEMVTTDRIEDYVGKEVAVRLLETDKVRGKHLLDGENIKVGGKGMIKFYDEIVPQAITKLLPKIGGEKLGSVGVPLPVGNGDKTPMGAVQWVINVNGREYNGYSDEGVARLELAELLEDGKNAELIDARNPETSQQPGFDVTDKMRETVGAGLPMFSKRVAPTNWRDEAGRVRFMPGAVAYRYAADIANSLLEKTPLIGSLKPIDDDLALAMRRMKTEIENAQTRTAGVATKLGELPEDERKLISDVIEGELKRGVKPAKRILDVAASMQSIMSEQSAELVRLGMLSAEAAGRWDGKYLPRFYETTLMTEANQWAKAAKALLGRKKTMQGIKGSSLKGRGIFETIPVDELEAWLAEGWEERDANFDPAVDTEITVWRDYSRDERENMGEIRDAMFRFVMGYMKSQRDVALGRMYENLADTVASKSEKEGYVQVPKTNIEDTTARRYGKLSGKWVPQEVLDHLSAFDSSMEGDLMKIYRKGLSMWKEGKTVLNPVAHANNVLSNLTMAHFAGVSYWDVNKYLGTVRDIVKGGPMLTEAREAGLFGGTVSQAELVSMLPDQLKVLAAKTESKVAKGVDTVWSAMSFFLRKPLGVAYEAEDLYFRFLIYRDARGRGMDPEDAVTYAQQYIFTYDDLPKGARTIRDAPIGIPFFSWTYKAIPMIARTALEYPWRMAAPAAAMYAANAAMYAVAAGMGGGDDEPWWEVMKRYVTDPEFREQAKQLERDERKNLPEWQKGYSSIGTPKAIRLGTDDLTNLPLFLDVSRIFPGGDLGDFHNNLGGVPLPAWLTPNNPVLTSMTAFLQNKDSFTGKEIVSAKLDTGGEKANKWGEYAWRQFAPAIAPFNYHFDRTMNAVANATDSTIDLGLKEYTGVDKMGQPVQPKYAAMQTFGIKVRPTDLEVSEQIEKTQREALIRDLDKQIRQISRLENKGYYSDEKAEKLKEPIREKRQRLKEGLTIEGEERE